MPAHKARIGSFDDLRDESRRIVEDALTEAVRQPDRRPTPGKRWPLSTTRAAWI